MPTVTYKGPKDKRGQSSALVVETPDGRVRLLKDVPTEVSGDQADAIVAAAQGINHEVSVRGRKRKDDDDEKGERAS